MGNPCTNERECHLHTEYNEYSYEYLYNHYFYTEDQYAKYKACILSEKDECKKVRDDLNNKFHETGTDRRNIFSDCLEQKTGDYPNIPCLDQVGILDFLNKQSVQKAIHA